jgi:hypothetical protein
MFEDELPKWDEQIEAVRRANERLGPLAAEKAKKYEHLTLEQVMAHWARVTSRRGGSEFESLDDLEAEVMAIFSVLGVKMGERGKVLRAAGFEYGEPMQ